MNSPSGPLPAKLRWVLTGAFGGLLALMLSAGLNALHLLSEMHVDEERARRVFAQRTQRLSSIYGSIQSYSETIQQYVLSPPSDADRTRDELRRLSAQVHYEFGRFAGQPSEVQPTLKA